jgi:hypothetical protein
MKKDIEKWYDFHKSPWNNTIDFFSKNSLVVEMKAYESDLGSDSEFKLENWRRIINIEPNARVSTTKIQPGEHDDS